MTQVNSVVPVVDCHAHLFRHDLPISLGDALHVPTYDFEMDDYLKILDDHGVWNAVIAAPSFLGNFNDYTLKALRGSPRLRGTAIVQPTIDPFILKAMDAGGIVGVRLSLRKRNPLPDFSSLDYQRFLYRLADLDWHVHVHLEGERLVEVLPALLKSPAKIVVDHFGRPDPKLGVDSEGFQTLLRALDSGRVWCKMSGAFRIDCDPQPLADRLLQVAGPEWLVWGSDC